MTVFLIELIAVLLVLVAIGVIADAWERRRVRDSWNRNHVSRRRR